MSIKNLESPFSPEFFNDEFMKYIEDRLPYFMDQSRTKSHVVDPAVAYKYEGDFYGLLDHMRIPHNLHYLNMRINGYTSPLQFGADVKNIITYTEGDETALAKALSTKVR